MSKKEKTQEIQKTEQTERGFSTKWEFVNACKEELQDFIKRGGNIKYCNVWEYSRLGTLQSKRVGTVVSILDGDKIKTGWSQLHEGVDRWNKYLGVHLAIKRLNEFLTPVPNHVIETDLRRHVEAAARRYKEAKTVIIHKNLVKNGSNGFFAQAVEMPIVRVDTEESILVETNKKPDKTFFMS
ncbi:MAG TPA: hypothetical protein PKW79_05950 [Rhabdochlamydiaceae bacterium]|nr:hypothetical protein [Rhabdochlamydiaceae bacterium]